MLCLFGISWLQSVGFSESTGYLYQGSSEEARVGPSQALTPCVGEVGTVVWRRQDEAQARTILKAQD